MPRLPFSFFKQGTNEYEVKDSEARSDIGDINTDIVNIQNAIAQISGTATHEVLIITDSYGTGVSADGQTTPFMDYFESAMGDDLSYINSNVVSGSGLLGDQYDRTTYYEALVQLKGTLDTEHKDLSEITDIIFCGFANDALFTDLSAIPTKMAEIQTYCTTNFPNAKVWFAPCGCKVGDANYNNKMLSVLSWLRYCYNYNINYMSGLDYILHNANMMSSDKLHPNAVGQKNIGNGLATIMKGGNVEVFDRATGVTMQNASNVNVHSDTFTITQIGDRIQLYKSSTAHWSPNSVNLTFNQSFSLVVGHIDYPTVCGNGVDTVSVPAIVLVGGRYYQCALEVALWQGDVVISGIIVDAQGNGYLSGICTDIQIPYFTMDVSAYT